MKRLVAAAVAVIAVAACAPVAPRPERSDAARPDRSDVLQRILASMVKLEAELEGDGRRTGSGVVIRSEPEADRCWILTTRHFLVPNRPRQIAVRVFGHRASLSAEVVKISDDLDLAIVSVRGVAPPAVTLKDTAHLGDEVWVIGFPWGRRLTVVSGVVSQIAGESEEPRLTGPPRMVDASVSYGSSGGGIFEASTGLLIGIVEGYRTARVALPQSPESVLHVPVPGETTVVSSAGIRRFLSSANLER